MSENHQSLVADEVITQLKERIAELEAQLISLQKLELMSEDDLRQRIAELEDFMRKVFLTAGVERALPPEWVARAVELLEKGKK